MVDVFIPYGKQDISKEDIEAVVNVLTSDFLTQGPQVTQFEDALSRYCGARYAVAVNSATSALHIACLAIGVSEGDSVWTVPNTFVASANCARYCGADVDFVDIDPKTYNMCPDALEQKIRYVLSNGMKLPKVIIPVHFAGQSCEMEKIFAITQQYGIKIIEDASHAVGGRYLGKAIGSCEYSDITVFSFHPVKIITSAEGGMALSNNAEYSRKMQLLRSHCVTRDGNEMSHSSEGEWYYEQVGLGFNYRMTDIQAALGRSQLTRLNDFINIRHKIAGKYNEQLAALAIELPYQHPDTYSAYHLYPIMVDKQKDRKEVFSYLRNCGIGANVHYIPVHLQPYYQGLGFRKGDYPNAESYYDRAISIPLYSGLTEDLQQIVVSRLAEIL